MISQRGGFALGLIVGLLIGLALALGVALYVTKVPVPQERAFDRSGSPPGPVWTPARWQRPAYLW